RGEGVIGPFQMGFPALVGRSARQLLVKKTNPPSAIDGEARVRRRWNGAQIVAAPGDATIAGFAHVKREMGGICSVSPGKIDPLAVVWIHGDRDSAPDALVSSQEPCRRRSIEWNRSAGHNLHPGHSIPRRCGLLTERSEGTTRTGSKVVVADHDHIARKWILSTLRPAKERGINRAAFMNGRTDRRPILSAGATRFDTVRRESCRRGSRCGVQRPVNGSEIRVAVPDVNPVRARNADRLHIRHVYTGAGYQPSHGIRAGKIIGPQNTQHMFLVPSQDSRVKHVAPGAESERNVVCASGGGISWHN